MSPPRLPPPHPPRPFLRVRIKFCCLRPRHRRIRRRLIRRRKTPSPPLRPKKRQITNSHSPNPPSPPARKLSLRRRPCLRFERSLPALLRKARAPAYTKFINLAAP